jgi:hypothetical protein
VNKDSVSTHDDMTPIQKLRNRRCFITAPADTDISPVTKSLVTRGVECKKNYRLDRGTTLETLKEQIKTSDFVCVFSPIALPPYMILEIGIAVGQSKPIFMLTAEGLPLPAELRFTSFVGANRWNADVIEPHLDAFLEALPKKSLESSPRKKSPRDHRR